MHIPQGGTQYTLEGADLWSSKKNQKRFIALWKAIAKRYKDEPVIAGYDLLNEPIVPRSRDQWKNLANQVTREIRTVDKNHLIIMESILGIATDWRSFHRIENLLLINDDNVLYSFHFYLPHSFTHQFAIWTQFKEGGKYPDDNTAESTVNGLRMKRNKEFIQYEFNKYIEFSLKNNVPIFCGEFGVDYHCFENNKGGINWVNDVMDILIKNDIHFTYHAYHESWFGVFQNDIGLPDEKQAVNELIELFKIKLLKGNN
jgi:aryl-phospho-beta-D-glucosidase BglC (GH1 family)